MVFSNVNTSSVPRIACGGVYQSRLMRGDRFAMRQSALRRMRDLIHRKPHGRGPAEDA
jgi:hypothetical protein